MMWSAPGLAAALGGVVGAPERPGCVHPPSPVKSSKSSMRASVATRIRLADTQTVVAIAELSDGSFWSASAAVVVTLAACLEEA